MAVVILFRFYINHPRKQRKYKEKWNRGNGTARRTDEGKKQEKKQEGWRGAAQGGFRVSSNKGIKEIGR